MCSVLSLSKLYAYHWIHYCNNAIHHIQLWNVFFFFEKCVPQIQFTIHPVEKPRQIWVSSQCVHLKLLFHWETDFHHVPLYQSWGLFCTCRKRSQVEWKSADFLCITLTKSLKSGIVIDHSCTSFNKPQWKINFHLSKTEEQIIHTISASMTQRSIRWKGWSSISCNQGWLKQNLRTSID